MSDTSKEQRSPGSVSEYTELCAQESEDNPQVFLNSII